VYGQRERKIEREKKRNGSVLVRTPPEIERSLPLGDAGPLEATSIAIPSMSTQQPNASPAKASKSSSHAQSGSERLKVVVRRLPPNLPENIFWESVQQWVSDDTAAWRAFYPGKFKKRYELSKKLIIYAQIHDAAVSIRRTSLHAHILPSRMSNSSHCSAENTMAIFSEIKMVVSYDSVVEPALIIIKGNESQAVVEFAPYPKIPTEKKKVDARVNTIEKGM
jgi:regulator of nonsense transcripts 3